MAWFLLAVCVAVLSNTVLVDAIPKGPGGLNLQNIIIVLLLLILMGSLAKPKDPSRPDWPKLGKWLIIYLAVTFLATWYGPIFTEWVGLPGDMDDFRIVGWRDEFTGILLFFIAARCLKTPAEMRRVMVVLVAASAYFVGYYLVRYYPEIDRIRALPMPQGVSEAQWTEDQKWMIKKVAGVFIHVQSNEMAAYYLYVAVFFTGLFWHYRSAFWRILVPIDIVLLFLGVVYSASRGAMLSAAAAFAYSLVRKKKWLVRVSAVLCAVVPAMSGAEAGLDQSAAGRIDLWRDALVMGIKHPIGVGYRLFSTHHQMAFGSHMDTHNLFMRAFAEEGPMGMFIIASFFMAAIKLGWTLHDNARSDFARGMGRGCALMWASALICNLFGDRLTYVEISVVVWTLTGMCMGLLVMEERDRLAEEQESIGTLEPTPEGTGSLVTSSLNQ
jgi:O-antigen ligase/polysaccharide polymerase Wzy-like membrane protein